VNRLQRTKLILWISAIATSSTSVYWQLRAVTAYYINPALVTPRQPVSVI